MVGSSNGSDRSLKVSSVPEVTSPLLTLLHYSIATIWPAISTLPLPLTVSHPWHIACNASVHNYSKIFGLINCYETILLSKTLMQNSFLLKLVDTEDQETVRILPNNNRLLVCANFLMEYKVILPYRKEGVFFQQNPYSFKMCFSLRISLTSRIYH